MHLRRRHLALLALPVLGNAVSLSDMTPRANGLPSMCNSVYTSQIWGCTPDDFSSHDCSGSCIGALFGLTQAIQHACSNQGIEGQNLVVAFLAGVGPQQLCHNIGSSWQTTAAQTSTTAQPVPSIISGTTTARKPTDTETTLLVDTSSASSETVITHATKSQITHTASPPPTTTKTSSKATLTTTLPVVGQSQTTSPGVVTTTSTAAGGSQTSLNDHSGGGSPFDTPGNMNSASGLSLSAASILLSAAAAMWTVLR